MSELFNKCIDVILKNEGGYVDNPVDPGGETKFGIAKRFFPNEDIKNLTIERAKEIYYNRYWKHMNLEGINDENVVLQMFDCGVNCGTSKAIKIAQNICLVDSDGVCGDKTKEAINTFAYNFLDAYKEERKNYYKSLVNKKPQLSIFLKGWLKRIEHTHF